MNNKDDILTKLQELDLALDEAKVYLELIREPNTHLRLSHATGINRTKVYRIVELLEKRSLVARRTDDRGTFLVATDPATLEVSLVTKQEEIEHQYALANRLIPALNALRNNDTNAFVVRNYDGQSGLKQMCWHELKAKGELVTFGNGTIEQIVDDDRWADRHRTRQMEVNYKTRELVNYDYGMELPELSSEKLITSRLYNCRKLSTDVLAFDSQTIVYNDTVAIYHWKHDQKIGVEIISPTYAQMMRQLFEHYWAMATPV